MNNHHSEKTLSREPSLSKISLGKRKRVPEGLSRFAPYLGRLSTLELTSPPPSMNKPDSKRRNISLSGGRRKSKRPRKNGNANWYLKRESEGEDIFHSNKSKECEIIPSEVRSMSKNTQENVKTNELPKQKMGFFRRVFNVFKKVSHQLV